MALIKGNRPTSTPDEPQANPLPVKKSQAFIPRDQIRNELDEFVPIPSSDPKFSALTSVITESKNEIFAAPKVDPIKILEEANQKAQEVMAKAQEEAKKLLEESQLYCQSAYAQAQRDGFEEGRQQGYEEGRQQAQAIIEEVKELFAQLRDERERTLQSLEPEVAKLALRIAREVIQSEVNMNQEIVLNTVRNALGGLKGRDEVILHINSEDQDLVEQQRKLLEKFLEGVKSFTIVSDSRVERGGCIIETNLGNVDARISTKLQTLETAFKEVELENVDSSPGSDQPQ
jgi:flagellar assembly protein FliH